MCSLRLKESTYPKLIILIILLVFRSVFTLTAPFVMPVTTARPQMLSNWPMTEIKKRSFVIMGAQ